MNRAVDHPLKPRKDRRRLRAAPRKLGRTGALIRKINDGLLGMSVVVPVVWFKW